MTPNKYMLHYDHASVGVVRLLALDVDGTLTDGQINMGPSGELFKSFDAKDGYGIKHLLPQHGIVSVIITGRVSAIVESRARELGIEHLYQGVTDKAACLRRVLEALGIPPDQTACMGDDLNDLPMMDICGFAACPGDAVQEVKERCAYVCKATGGHGAVREFIDWAVHGGISEYTACRGKRMHL